MTAFRLVPLHLHGALELLVGLALMVVPFALGLSSAALVAGLLVGVIVAGLAVRAAIGDDFDVAAHYAYDIALVIGLLAGAIALAAVGDGPAAVLFAGAAILALALNVTTRYSAAR
jgi:hypothetical protein